MNYWLLKSEPGTFSIDDLAKLPQQRASWEGVRNYQARNLLRDQIKLGDLALFYHSSCPLPGIVGVVEVVKPGYPDTFAFDPSSKYFDEKSHPDHPRWFMIDVQLKEKFAHIISLEKLRQNTQLSDMLLLRRGNRLSVMPVAKNQWQVILNLRSDP